MPSKTPFIGQHLKSYFRILSGSDSLDCLVNPEIVLETEGSVHMIQKRAFFKHIKVKKDTLSLAYPYVHSLFTVILI